MVLRSVPEGSGEVRLQRCSAPTYDVRPLQILMSQGWTSTRSASWRPSSCRFWLPRRSNRGSRPTSPAPRRRPATSTPAWGSRSWATSWPRWAGNQRLALEPAYHKAKSVGFEFLEVQEEAIQIAALDQYLAVAQLNPIAFQIKRLLEADSLYVVTAVLKSNKLNVQAKDDHNEKIQLDVSQLQAALGVGGKLAISGFGQESSAIQYSGGERLAFGFQAIQVALNAASTWVRTTRAGAAAMGGGLSDPNAVRHDVPAGPDGHVLIGGADAPFVQFRGEGAGQPVADAARTPHRNQRLCPSHQGVAAPRVRQ